MTAAVIPSLAMEPGVRTVNGFQAVCLEHPDTGQLVIIGELMEEGVWISDWSENWIHARIEAVAHNLAEHPGEIPAPRFPAWGRGLKGKS